MLQISLQQLFPQLTKLSLNPLSVNQFTTLPYFSRYISLISQKQCKLRAQKSHKFFKLIKLKRGTVIYASDDIAERGYILLDGCVKLVKKKNNREKTQLFPGHYLSTQQQKYRYLNDQFKIPRNKAENLIDVFYQQKFQFKYLPFHTIYSKEDFGFGEMVRNTNRIQTAIAVQQSQVLIIQKSKFDQLLRDFQQKKQNSLINSILHGCRQQIIEQMLPRMQQIMNTALLVKKDNEDLIYDETDYPSNLYYVIDGQIQIRKKAILSVPKKFMKHEIKDPIQKQLMIKIYKAGKYSFFGEEQIFSNRKQRSFIVYATLNDTIVLKIDQNSFLKAISDFTGYQKMLIQNAVFKKVNADQSYDRQYKKIYSSFINQYQAYDSSKKEKMLSNLMKQDHDKHQMFEAFAPQGVFFRDTFQKLQGFQQAQKSPNKRSSIKKFRQKGDRKSSPNINEYHSGHPIQTHGQKFSSHQVTQKILFSPKKTINVVDFYADELKQRDEQNLKTESEAQKAQNKTNSLAFAKKQKSLGRFQQIQKDQAIFKRVMIKNGLYPIDKKIDKSQSVKPLIHHNFDQVVKQCISRKNQALKRSSKQKQNQIIVETYQRSVMSLRKKPSTQSSIKFSRYTTPCKGTEQLKKRMQSYHNLGSGRLSDLSLARKKSLVSKIQDCIGVNQKPKSQQIPYRANAMRSTMFATQKSPQRIVLLNHMMKPIVYSRSNQLLN